MTSSLVSQAKLTTPRTGTFADYFTTLCLDKNGKGMVLLVIERDDTVSTKAIKTSYSAGAGTAYVEFDKTVVPAENLIGKEGLGFMYAMANFNKERWGMVAAGNRMSRLMVAECFKWAVQREVFGKKLIEQPVIRQKLAAMAAEVEAVHSMLEDLTYQVSVHLLGFSRARG
jgi:alkylation response protein AidB-like acyl-CoA dehydrogenase